jgi:hypothetical protein
MRILILRQTCIAGRPILPGEVVEVTAQDARYLMARGKAEAVQDPLPQPVASKPRPRKPSAPGN